MSEERLQDKQVAQHRSRGRPPDAAKNASNRNIMLETAFNLFVEAGYDQSTVDQIAKGAKQSKGGFYWHFTGKEDCLRQALEEKAQRIEDYVSQAFARRGTACEQLETLVRVEDWCDADLIKTIALLAQVHHVGRPVLREFAHEIKARWVREATRTLQNIGRDAALEHGWSEQRLSAFDFEVWAQCWVATAEGLLAQMRAQPKGKFKAARISETLRSVFVEPLFRDARRGQRIGEY